MPILDSMGRPILQIKDGKVYPDPAKCTHGVEFDEEAAKGLDEYEIRRRWPRLHGSCPLGCGYHGIYYASPLHCIMGDW